MNELCNMQNSKQALMMQMICPLQACIPEHIYNDSALVYRQKPLTILSSQSFPCDRFPFPKDINNDLVLCYKQGPYSVHKSTLVVFNRLVTHQYINTNFGL